MRRSILLFVLLVLFAGFMPGAAAIENFDTPLYTDDLDVDFRIDGWAVGRIAVDTVTIDIQYSLSLENPAYNKTSADMTAYLTNESGVIATTSFKSFTLNQDSPKTDNFRITATADPAEVDRVEFTINHTATLRNGQTTNRLAGGGFDIEVIPGDQAIEYVRAEPADVHRGNNATIAVSTSNIAQLSAHNESLEEGEAGMFYRERHIPVSMTPGNHTWRINLTTGRETVFIQEYTVRVLNNPPTVTVNAPNEAQVGIDVPIVVKTSDDGQVADTTVTFRNQTVPQQDNTHTLPTAGLATGTYTFNVSVTDDLGATVQKTGSVTLTTDPQQSDEDTGGDGGSNSGTNENTGSTPGETGNTQTGGPSQQYSENESFLISVVSGIRGFIENLLFG